MTKQQIRWIPFAAFLTVFTASLGWAESIPPANVKGEVIKIEGATYVVKDTSGKEVKLQVDATTTKKDGEVKVGDHVDVDVTPQGYARVIRKDGGERMNMAPNGMGAPSTGMSPSPTPAPSGPGIGAP